MDREEILHQLRATEFRRNNRVVLQTINILRHSYMKLSSAASVLDSDISNADFWDCVNFLQAAGYIHIRNIKSRHAIELADCNDYGLLEAKLSEKGIRLMNGVITDEMIEN